MSLMAEMLTEMKVPDGGEASSGKRPQHTIEPSVRTPQARESPALTEAKVPDGGDASPGEPPQHATEPSVCTPQARESPTLTEVKVPGCEEDNWLQPGTRLLRHRWQRARWGSWSSVPFSSAYRRHRELSLAALTVSG